MILHEARRCVNAISIYLRDKDDSPRAAADLLEAVRVIEENQMEVKTFEIRDRNTFMPMLAIRLQIRDNKDYFLLRRAGYGEAQIMDTEAVEEPYIILVKLDGVEAQYDSFNWPNPRTLGNAHRYIISHWYELSNGDVIDVEFILGETKTPKISERGING